MRVLAATLAVLLLVAICSLAEADLRVSRNAELHKNVFTDTVPTACCFSFVSFPIPRHRISSAYRTSTSCSTQGVILITKKGKQLCADPEAQWVQKHLEHFEHLED
ncbi:C-C motif chemokine 3-like [Prinia subflava]|uniref:C-C motif chemokine 3-like n=1 Tax=Prinia subflava TaxID=208062 RepID=UPI002FE0EA7A